MVPTTLPQQSLPTQVWTWPISGIAPQGPLILPQGLIYAENVPASGNTVAGGYLRSLDVQTNALNWTYAVHDNSQIPTPVIPASVAAADGVVYVAAQATDPAGATFFELHAVDLETGLPVWPEPAQFTAQAILTRPAIGNGWVVVGATVPKVDTSGASALFWTDVASGQMVKSAPNLYSVVDSMTDPVIDGSIAYFGLSYDSNDPGINAMGGVNLNDGSLQWEGNPQRNISGGIALGDALLYATCADGSVIAMNVTETNQGPVWTKTLGTQPITGKPVVVGSTVYVGAPDGVLYALDGTTGNERWRLNTESSITTDLVFEDGVLYFANQGDGLDVPPTFYSVDTVSQGNDVLTFPVPDADTILFAEGAANGVVYFYSTQHVYAVNMDTIIHEFQVDTQMIVENYDFTKTPQGSSGPLPTDTSYRVTLTLTDPQGKPRIFQGVKVWASDTLSMTNFINSQGQVSTIQLGPQSTQWLETDAAGKVSLALSAFDADGTPLIACPTVLAWANFMMPEETIVIYPDHENATTLSTVRGNATDASTGANGSTNLASATGYDGTPLLSASYQTGDGAATSQVQIAQTIRNSVGATTPPSLNAVRGSVAAKYLAYPETMPNVRSLGDASTPITRPYIAGAIPHWTLTRAADGTVAFQQLAGDSDAQTLIQQLVAESQGTFVVGIQRVGEADNIFHSIKDFVQHVVKDTVQLVQHVWTVVDNVATMAFQTLENGIKNLYQLTIATLEDALTAVVGFIKQVVDDIKKIAQFLSFLFSWDDIKCVHKALEARVESNITAGITWLSDHKTDIVTFFGTTLVADVDQFFGPFTQSPASASSTQTYQAQNGNPNQVYNQNGKNHSSSCNFVQQKTMESSAAASVGLLPLTAVALDKLPYKLLMPQVHNRRSELATTLGDCDPNDLGCQLGTLLSNFVDTLVGQVDADFFGTVVGKVKAAISTFSDPHAFFNDALHVIAAAIQGVVDGVLKLTGDIIGDVIDLLVDLLQLLYDFLKAPLLPNIPFVSDLFEHILGEPLSYVGLISLLAAVPSTVLYKVITGQSPACQINAAGVFVPTAVAGAPTVDQLISFFINVFASVLDGLSELAGSTVQKIPILKHIGLSGWDLTADLFQQWVGNWIAANDGVAFDNVTDGILWAFGWCPIVSSTLGLLSDENLVIPTKLAAFGKTWASIQPYVTSAYGVLVLMVLIAYNTSFATSEYTDGRWIAANVLGSCLPYLFEPVGDTKDEEVKLAWAAVKGAMELAAAGINLDLSINPPPGSALQAPGRLRLNGAAPLP